ncbi:hypothetical protein V8G54_013419 [Vigna mungo]|uniref:Uncharacterized protein n=1 Tax=Vigna mungo TaxID=3915 RepID=A0AAQ3NUN8_VIGMU
MSELTLEPSSPYRTPTMVTAPRTMSRRFRNGESESLGLGSGLDSGVRVVVFLKVVVGNRLILAELVLGNKNEKNGRDDGGDGSLVVLKEIHCMDEMRRTEA